MCSQTRKSDREERPLEEVIDRIRLEDPRYHAEAYEFVLLALNRVVESLAEHRHISGAELSEGIRGLALELYGPMARTVLEHWGIRGTIDFGHIVFHLVDHKILSRTDEDTLRDFDGVFDFENAFAVDMVSGSRGAERERGEE
ncbi:MAG: hypothetical protein JW958_06675 [Candidatus Eisenbacteria bacterium]|nr:hypothetical protein [Candidatus Eisenbacteria bacterium]